MLLAGCASEPPLPYWQNPDWINALGNSIQENIVYPEDILRTTLTDKDFPAGRATVQFTYDQGKLDDVAIVESTGNQILDKAIISEIESMRLVLVHGASSTIPHRFQLTVAIGPADYQFIRQIWLALKAHAWFPHGITDSDFGDGLVIAKFQYRNGEISNPVIIKSSDLQAFDLSVLDELKNIKLPAPPAWLNNRTLELQVPFCFSTGSKTCPGMVLGVRYVGSDDPGKLPTTTH